MVIYTQWSQEIADLGDRIVTLNVKKAAELVEYLEQVHGITAVTLPGRRDDVVRVEQDSDATPPSAFDVVLDGHDAARKIDVLRAVRECTGLGLKETKNLVEAAPSVMKASLSEAEAGCLKQKLEAAGAHISLRPAQ